MLQRSDDPGAQVRAPFRSSFAPTVESLHPANKQSAPQSAHEEDHCAVRKPHDGRRQDGDGVCLCRGVRRQWGEQHSNREHGNTDTRDVIQSHSETSSAEPHPAASGGGRSGG